MLKLSFFLPVIAFMIGCSSKTEPQSDAEKIAAAYGINNFNQIKKLTYTFNVQRDTTHIWRTWVWDKEGGNVTMITGKDTVSYSLDSINDKLKTVDHRFINDKYWLLFPFQLVWDDNLTIINSGLQTAPVSGNQLTKITARYGSTGGYTPGDAYDLYVDENWFIREWVFRKSDQAGASLTTTWEGYTDVNGISVATDHYTKDRNFRLYFTKVNFE